MKKFSFKLKNVVALLILIVTISNIVSAPINWGKADHSVVYCCGDDESIWCIETR